MRLLLESSRSNETKKKDVRVFKGPICDFSSTSENIYFIWQEKETFYCVRIKDYEDTNEWLDEGEVFSIKENIGENSQFYTLEQNPSKFLQMWYRYGQSRENNSVMNFMIWITMT